MEFLNWEATYCQFLSLSLNLKTMKTRGCFTKGRTIWYFVIEPNRDKVKSYDELGSRECACARTGVWLQLASGGAQILKLSRVNLEFVRRLTTQPLVRFTEIARVKYHSEAVLALALAVVTVPEGQPNANTQALATPGPRGTRFSWDQRLVAPDLCLPSAQLEQL
jgi:hypothetical protein